MSAPVLQFSPGGDGVYVDLEKLVPSRLLVQGSSGAGKSWLIRYILEQTHGRIQQFVFDPEGEFVTLREKFDYVVASAGGDGDVPAHPDTADLLCRQLVELQASAIFDIYELEPEDREQFVANFLSRLIKMPKEQWRPALVVVDEAHELAPQSGQPPSRKPMELLVSKGRKRGLCSIFSTQRISKLSKNASDMQNILVGLTGLDTDVRRAGDLLGFDKEQREELKRLEEGQGEFFAFGPAISRAVVKVRSGSIQTHHPKAGELRAPTPPARGALAQLVAQLSEIPDRAAEEERTVEALEAQVAQLQAQMAAKPRPERAAAAAPTEEQLQARIRKEAQVLAGPIAAEAAQTAIAGLRAELQPRVEGVRSSARMLVASLDDLHHALGNGNGKHGHPLDLADSHPAPRERSTPPAPRSRPAPPAAAPRGGAAPAPGGAAVPPAWQRILDAAASLAAVGVKSPSRKNVAVFARMSPKSSAYDGHVAKLVQAGLLEYPADGHVGLTAEGKRIGRPTFRPKSVEELHEAWFQYLSDAQVRILRPLLKIHPRPLSREQLGVQAVQSHKSSAFDGHIAELASLGLVNYPQDRHVATTELLFPAGLR